MFRITEDPSPGCFIQCLAKITGMVLSCPLFWPVVHTHYGSKYAAITPTMSMSTDKIEQYL